MYLQQKAYCNFCFHGFSVFDAYVQASESNWIFSFRYLITFAETTEDVLKSNMIDGAEAVPLFVCPLDEVCIKDIGNL